MHRTCCELCIVLLVDQDAEDDRDGFEKELGKAQEEVKKLTQRLRIVDENTQGDEKEGGDENRSKVSGGRESIRDSGLDSKVADLENQLVVEREAKSGLKEQLEIWKERMTAKVCFVCK